MIMKINLEVNLPFEDQKRDLIMFLHGHDAFKALLDFKEYLRHKITNPNDDERNERRAYVETMHLLEKCLKEYGINALAL